MIIYGMTSPFLQQTRSFSDISIVDDPDLLLRALNKFSSDVAFAVNIRTVGIYNDIISSTGNSFNGTQTSRIISIVPSILSGTTSVSTTIQKAPNLKILCLYGVATNGSVSIPIPYLNVAAPGDSIGLSFDLTTASVQLLTTTANWTSYSAFVNVEFAYVI